MIKWSYFIFNGERSYDYKIHVENQPDIISPQRRIERLTINGRNGDLIIDENTYESYTKMVTCKILDKKYLDKISSWLKGSGKVIFSNEKDKYYNCFIANKIDFTKVMIYHDWYNFPVIFDCQPIKHSVNKVFETHTITRSNYKFYGEGTVEAEPIITIYGNGNIEVDVNGNKINLSGVDGHVTINSEIMDCYKDMKNQNMKMVGSFPKLLANGQENVISYMGDVSKIEVVPNWGWI